MRVHVLALVPIFTLACCAQTTPGIAREGGYWVETVTGSLTVDRPGLRVETRGSLRVRGERRGDILYTMKKRVRARTEADARRKLQQIAVKLATGKPWPTFSVSLPDPDSGADIDVVVDRAMRDLVLKSQGGVLEARDLDGRLNVDLMGGAVTMDRIGGHVILRTGGGSVRVGRLGGGFECTSAGGMVTADSIAGSAVVRTGGGNITLRDVKGTVQAFTGAGGNIRIEEAGGSVTASTNGGVIDVLNAAGPVHAQAGTGAIRIQMAKSVNCETGTGAIKLQQVSGRVHVATGNGAIFAELARGLEDSFLSTGLGDITIAIPSNLAVTVQALADSQGLRKIVSDFPEIHTLPEARGARAEAQGALNGGGPLLRVAATGGTVYLRRQTELTEKRK